MNEYLELKDTYAYQLSKATKRHNIISTARLVVVILLAICIFYYFKTDYLLFLLVSALSVISFLALMKMHQKVLFKKLMFKTLVDINTDEINFLNHQAISFADGNEFVEADHPYAADFDIFGKNSIYQHINRTATYIGSKKLASNLLVTLPTNQIVDHQEAIKELAPKTIWRQKIQAIGKINQDHATVYHQLIAWSKSKSSHLPALTRILSFLSPISLLTISVACALTQSDRLFYIAVLFFSFNILLLVIHLKKIKQEIFHFDRIHKIILQYSLLLKAIEDESFQCRKINQLKATLKHENKYVSEHVKHLSALFNNLESIHNGAGAILFNGFFLYHIHQLNALLKWKNKFASHIEHWLDAIGEIEVLSSLANFSHQNPPYVFPDLNTQFEITFENLGHPLIKEQNRVCNSISFKNQKFRILTGSNMSGKSTFLRCVGVNMVLAAMGAPICSTSANIHPLPIYASMRLADSLSDHESYFFAELKRLKQIIDQLKKGPCFILLDEILRGTNSDDKRTGTIAIVRKMIKNEAIGIIATHDLEVCDISAEFPEYLKNNCFEVDIVNHDLHFDYKLRDGICKNKSASFLMDKMGII